MVLKGGKFCSSKCNGLYYGRIRNREATVELECSCCKKVFYKLRKDINKGEGKYCSYACSARMTKNGSGSKRSHDFRKKMSLLRVGKPNYKLRGRKRPDITGEKNHNWNGGSSKAYKTGYWGAEYQNWRRLVFQRDNFECQQCRHQGYITAHHKKSWANYPDLRYEISNGQTLCEPCHAQTDNYKGRNKKGGVL